MDYNTKTKLDNAGHVQAQHVADRPKRVILTRTIDVYATFGYNSIAWTQVEIVQRLQNG
jgi:hypothetical protein